MKAKLYSLKTVCVLLAAILLLSACGSGNAKTQQQQPAQTEAASQAATTQSTTTQATTTQSKEESLVTPPGEFPVVTKPVTLSFFTPQAPNIPDMLTNEFTVMYEEKTGVHIEWELVPMNALGEKKSISLASGQYPDVYFAANITREEVMVYGPGGIFIALNDLIDKYNPELVKLYDEDPTVLPAITAPDGNIYSYPTTNGNRHGLYASRLWFNKEFADNLGIPMPTTTDEFYDAMQAFKTQDPNKNGKNDEIPLVIAYALGDLTYFMNSFVYFNAGDGFIVSSDDKVTSAFNQDGWKEAIIYLNKLYKNELLDQTSFTLSGEQLRQLIENDAAMMVGAAPGMAPSSIMNPSGDRQHSYIALPPLKGPQGVQYTGYYPYTTSMGNMVVTKACKYPEVAARWVDWLYTWEGALTSREGPEGKGWKVPDPGTISYAGIPATYMRLAIYGADSNFKWDGIGYPHNMDIHPQMALDPAATIRQPEVLYQAAVEYCPFRPEKVLPPMYMPNDIVKEYAQYKTDITKFVTDYTVRFITGNANIESEWSSYINNLDKMGIDKYIKITQDAYDEFVKVNGQPKYKI